jgi:hypothetical protein
MSFMGSLYGRGRGDQPSSSGLLLLGDDLGGRLGVRLGRLVGLGELGLLAEVRDDALGVGEQDHRVLGQRDLARVDDVAHIHVRDIDLDLLGEVGHRALELELGDRRQHRGAGLLEAGRLAHEVTLTRTCDALVEIDARQVAVDDVGAQVVELQVAEQDGLGLAALDVRACRPGRRRGSASASPSRRA